MTVAARGGEAPSPTMARLIAVVFLPFAGGYFLSYLFRSTNAVIAPQLTAQVGLTAADLGLLTSCYFLAFASFQLPLGLLLDRYGPRRVQSALLLSAALGAALFAIGDSLAELAIAPRPEAAAHEDLPEPTSGRGAIVYNTIGCAACHSVDGSTNGKSGPTWKGLAGAERLFEDGGRAEATSAYLRESILEPGAKVTRGYNPKDVGMPSYRGILSDTDIESLILYIESLTN